MNRVLTMAGWLFFSLWAVGTALIVAGRVLNPFFNDLWHLGFVPLVIAAVRIRRDRRMGGAFAGVGFLFLLCGIHPRGPVDTKTFVLGVDGATFEVIDSHSDELPNFSRLRPEATRATLLSMEPMFSPLLWTTIASGRTPDEHGIKGFRVQSHDCQVARFWDIAENAGMGVGLYKWLVDYPPRTFKHGGFWVPSWLAPEINT